MEARGKQSCIFKMLKENKKTALKKKKKWVFSAIRNIKEISKEVISERRKIISKWRPKMPIEILILENDKCEHEPYNNQTNA